MSLCLRKRTIWVPTRSDTNRAENSHRRWLEAGDFGIPHPCIENKGADQLRSYCEADLRLCFRLCRLLVFQCGGSNTNDILIRSVIHHHALDKCDYKKGDL